MSIEGMWCFVSGEVSSDMIASGGVVILDTQRIYGGDSAMAYVGTYQTSGGTVEGAVESFGYLADVGGHDVFGQEIGPPRTTMFAATLSDDGLLIGHLERGGVRLPLALRKLRELP